MLLRPVVLCLMLLPVLARAQRMPAPLLQPVTAAHASGERPVASVRFEDSAPRTRGDHALRGALIGAAVGFVAGVVGANFYQTGCPISAGRTCNETRTKIGLMLFTGVEGAVVGAIVGVGVGAVWPTQEAIARDGR